MTPTTPATNPRATDPFAAALLDLAAVRPDLLTVKGALGTRLIYRRLALPGTTTVLSLLAEVHGGRLTITSDHEGVLTALLLREARALGLMLSADAGEVQVALGSERLSVVAAPTVVHALALALAEWPQREG